MNPTEDEIRGFIRERSNWGRWGADDQMGAMNLVTPEKTAKAAALVRSGRTVSLSRPFPVTPAIDNPNPAHHYMRFNLRPDGGGGATDYYGISYHGFQATHIDSLCHIWGEDGMWNGRPGTNVTPTGANWGGFQNWKNGIVTRGVLMDVPKFRGEPYVTLDKPVTGPELEAIEKAQGVAIEPGDALVVYSGRDEYSRHNVPWGGGPARPGLHGSCLPYFRNRDISVLIWDMMDMLPSGYDNQRLPVHAALYAYGVALVDNSHIETLAQVLEPDGRFDFMLMLSPLYVVGGTGSPINPIAVL